MTPLILLVDDSADVGLIVRRQGERAGQRVEVRPTGELGWEYLQETRPNLAILDVNLPGMSGTDLCRQIRAAPRLADLPVALLGQADRPEDIVAGLDAGVDFVFSKDLLTEPAEWVQRVQEALTGGSVRQSRSTLHSHYATNRLLARLGEPVLTALLRQMARYEGATNASNVNAKDWLARLDGTAEANARLADFMQHLERVLGRQWSARLWAAPGQEPAARKP